MKRLCNKLGFRNLGEFADDALLTMCFQVLEEMLAEEPTREVGADGVVGPYRPDAPADPYRPIRFSEEELNVFEQVSQIAIREYWTLDPGPFAPAHYAAAHGHGAKSETEAKRAKERVEKREREAMPHDAKEATHVGERVQDVLESIEAELMRAGGGFEGENG